MSFQSSKIKKRVPPSMERSCWRYFSFFTFEKSSKIDFLIYSFLIFWHCNDISFKTIQSSFKNEKWILRNQSKMKDSKMKHKIKNEKIKKTIFEKPPFFCKPLGRQNYHAFFTDYCKCQPIMVQPTCNATNSTIAENSWGSKLENVLVNSTWHYLYHPCHIWQMSILNDSSNFWNFYFWKKHCCCGNGGGTYW